MMVAQVYKFGFQEDECTVAEAKERALAHIRKDNQNPVISGPLVQQSDDHAVNNEFIIRIVTGVEGDKDPLDKGEE